MYDKIVVKMCGGLSGFTCKGVGGVGVLETHGGKALFIILKLIQNSYNNPK
ncbi:hypothetical protein JWV37_11575 [Sulfurospirillum sp. T05]|uniref:Uncharacterized protein n=1 Tax=Sulfurospirillum tamanense TaxID=2813362 RepID=A0ABS2WVJ9_9BACT|nr:hypothetical protein [Sulfurospirillum tamanensis]MBN2965423.1 hypothetical protein [Sulfurospirillum tamanensis]